MCCCQFTVFSCQFTVIGHVILSAARNLVWLLALFVFDDERLAFFAAVLASGEDPSLRSG
jgi:hypothetical protein